MTVYQVCARYVAQPVAADWRERLASHLGSRPRRLGRWAELGLYGALECLAADGESTLAEHAALVLSSQHGPALAMRSALAQVHEDLPLPLTFLQTQPSQLLATLSAYLGWSGDARFITHPDPFAVLALATALSHADGLLVGWVDEIDVESSVWLRLRAVADPGGDWCRAGDFAMLVQCASHVRLGSSELTVIIDPQLGNVAQKK
ncbi:hypothetical protein [Rhodoferax saidenbachensis]|uniref:Uncharacterized protein n=1 Tax=Rhodoferax saidenbachensis TaxID=1484693 RepID=A0ABU1ZMF1_9BURK|nr:hypothetical protein [Rhodoferax saidenbachensis]MDR7306085.1 hypothetical protein [Rhodoferax saidenbachensis]